MYTLVGVITNTHGIKGAVKVYPYTFDKNRFQAYNKLYLGEKKQELNIETVSYHKNLVILSFKEFKNINEVLNLKEEKLFIKSEHEAKLSEGKYFVDDILNSNVYDTENNYLGRITEIIPGIANDVYVLKNDNKTGMIPAVKDLIVEVDIKEKRLVIKPMEGIFDEV